MSLENGRLIVNADDWGRDESTTDKILRCCEQGAVSSVSAMVYMEDSSRAAALSRERGIEAGLHLNLTTPFSQPGCPPDLLNRQAQLAQFLLRRRLTQVVYHPGHARSFEYVVKTQIDEFRRLYGAEPQRIDGHHHMHLCANVLFQRLLPPGIIVRRNFSRYAGDERGSLNNFYRNVVDERLARRYRVTDFFFSLFPLEPLDRLQYVYSLADRFVVEIAAHPARPTEYDYLAGGNLLRHISADRIFRPTMALSPLSREVNQ
jgi:predicted glycoside hydrolase/deacetylase ChbG (UPF0249 family)